MADYVMNEPGILDFANGLFQAKDDKYSCYILIDKNTPEGQAEAKRIVQAINEAIVEGTTNGGKNQDGTPHPAPLAGVDPNDKEQVKRLSLPLKDGDTDRFTRGEHNGELRKDVYKEFAGHWFMKLTAGNHRMCDEGLIRDKTNRPVAQRDVYSGNKVRAKIWFAPWSREGNRGIQARLNALLIVEPGEALYERRDADPFSGFGLPDAPGADDADPFSSMGI